MSNNEVMNADADDEAQEKDSVQPRFQPKGNTGMTYASVTGAGVGQCQTASVKVPTSGSRLTDTDDVSRVSPPTSMKADEEMEFTFPTLNSQASTSSNGMFSLVGGT
jgi:hypothetical protein